MNIYLKEQFYSILLLNLVYRINYQLSQYRYTYLRSISNIKYKVQNTRQISIFIYDNQILISLTSNPNIIHLINRKRKRTIRCGCLSRLLFFKEESDFRSKIRWWWVSLNLVEFFFFFFIFCSDFYFGTVLLSSVVSFFAKVYF